MVTREEMEAELMRLKKIQFIKPTAMELRQGRHALVNRTQRRENRRYKRIVKMKKEKLTRLLSTCPKKQEFDLNSRRPKRTLTRVESKKRLRGKR
ncbi:unnamed protein product [marine sediment metagenome]|uniref:Uncharacterized protein n=1 Tax=marine sediment metagenome TaxID=412755 RepID=X1BJP2_9ZZZZ